MRRVNGSFFDPKGINRRRHVIHYISELFILDYLFYKKIRKFKLLMTIFDKIQMVKYGFVKLNTSYFTLLNIKREFLNKKTFELFSEMENPSENFDQVFDDKSDTLTYLAHQYINDMEKERYEERINSLEKQVEELKNKLPQSSIYLVIKCHSKIKSKNLKISIKIVMKEFNYQGMLMN